MSKRFVRGCMEENMIKSVCCDLGKSFDVAVDSLKAERRITDNKLGSLLNDEFLNSLFSRILRQNFRNENAEALNDFMLDVEDEGSAVEEEFYELIRIVLAEELIKRNHFDEFKVSEL